MIEKTKLSHQFKYMALKKKSEKMDPGKPYKL